MNIMLLLTLCIMMYFPGENHAQNTSGGIEATISVSPQSEFLKRLYDQNGNHLMWYCERCDSKRKAMISILDHAEEYGLPAVNKSNAVIANPTSASDDEKLAADQKLSELAFSFCRDLYCGREIERWTSFDTISSQYRTKDMDRLTSGLAAARDSAELVSFISQLEPKTAEYNNLKQALSADTLAEHRRQQIQTSLNYYRWIHHFQFDNFIVVNIPSATLKLHKGTETSLEMLSVVGKKTTQTPRFVAYCKQVTLYPYWNVPRSILMNELYDKLKKNPGYLDDEEMEIVNKNGKVVSPSDVDWSSVNKADFPYRVREKPGCSNALGVLKFSLDDPFDVYMHDTNSKGAFASKKRFLSHGCIRLEKPVDLANAILPSPVDDDYLNACYKDEKPQVVEVTNPIPVFVVYMCAESDAGRAVQYYDDVYELLK